MHLVEDQLLWLFPGEVRVVSSEVSEGSGLKVDWAAEVQITHDHSRTQIEVLLDDGEEFSIGVLGGSVGVHVDGKWFGNSNSVRDLN